eukprot:6010063-Amphidinium_carterae.1
MSAYHRRRDMYSQWHGWWGSSADAIPSSHMRTSLRHHIFSGLSAICHSITFIGSGEPPLSPLGQLACQFRNYPDGGSWDGGVQ